MIRINLLPYRAARKKENVRYQFSVYIGSVFLACLLVFWINMYFSGKIKDLNSEIANTQAQVAKYQEINKEIAEIKKNLTLLEKKIEVIQSLQRDRKDPVKNLDSLYQLLVEKRMWYTQIEESGETYKVSGVAIDNQTVADYMTRIERSDRFQTVRLASIKQYKLQGKEDLSLKQFDVNFQKKPFQKSAAEVKK
ncbi:MAG: PilN domain-containing protein [Desulfobacteraceae bacterium]|nr:PilN domain-containing protein [Desulfobacteraceae bacterium]